MKHEITTFVTEFFRLGHFTFEVLEIIEKEENIFTIKGTTDEDLIGYNGQIFNHLQQLIRTMVRKNFGPNIKISLDINDFQQSKDEHLKEFILSKIAIVEKNGGDIQLPFYNGFQRKKIHSIVSEYNNPEIYSESRGEGKQRRIHIGKNTSKLTIDVDGLGI